MTFLISNPRLVLHQKYALSHTLTQTSHTILYLQMQLVINKLMMKKMALQISQDHSMILGPGEGREVRQEDCKVKACLGYISETFQRKTTVPWLRGPARNLQSGN